MAKSKTAPKTASPLKNGCIDKLIKRLYAMSHGNSTIFTSDELRNYILTDPKNPKSSDAFNKLVKDDFVPALQSKDPPKNLCPNKSTNITYKLKRDSNKKIIGHEFSLINPPPTKQYNRKESKPNIFSKVQDELDVLKNRFKGVNDDKGNKIVEGYISKIGKLDSILEGVAESINSIDLNDLLATAEHLTCEAKPDIMEEKRQALEDCVTALESFDYNPDDLNEAADGVAKYNETMFDPLKTAKLKGIRPRKNSTPPAPISTSSTTNEEPFDETRFIYIEGEKFYLDLPEFKEFEDEYNKDRKKPNPSYNELVQHLANTPTINHLDFEQLPFVIPLKRLHHELVVIFNERAYFLFQVSNGEKARPSIEKTPCDYAEPAFDLVKPRTVFRSVNKLNFVRVVSQEIFPCFHGFQDALSVFDA